MYYFNLRKFDNDADHQKRYDNLSGWLVARDKKSRLKKKKKEELFFYEAYNTHSLQMTINPPETETLILGPRHKLVIAALCESRRQN